MNNCWKFCTSYEGDGGGDDACYAKSVGDDFDGSKIDGGDACIDLDAIDISSSKNVCNDDDGYQVAVLGNGTKIENLVIKDDEKVYIPPTEEERKKIGKYLDVGVWTILKPIHQMNFPQVIQVLKIPIDVNYFNYVNK